MRTFEEIADDLAYYSVDKLTRGLVVQTIERLPKDVQDFALDRCCFLSVGGAASGQTLPGDIATHSATGQPQWLILLSDTLPPEHPHGIIAHEIAHAWRGDNALDPSVP